MTVIRVFYVDGTSEELELSHMFSSRYEILLYANEGTSCLRIYSPNGSQNYACHVLSETEDVEREEVSIERKQVLKQQFEE